MKKWLLLLFVILALAGGLFFILRPSGERVEQKQIEKVKVERGDLELTVVATGTVTPYVEVEVKSKAGGEIVSFPFEEGDVLKKGEVAVKLDPDTEQSRVNQANADSLMAEARLEKAKINLRDAELRLERQKILFKDGVISEQELDDALIVVGRTKSDVKIGEAELVRAREALKEAQDRLMDTKVRAPLSGAIIKKYVEEGQVIASTLSSASEGTLLFTMADLGRLYVEAMVDETDIGRIRTGQEAKITVDAYPEKQFGGKVVRIAPKGRVESTVTVFDVVVEVVDVEKPMLKPMMTANVEILYDVRKKVLLVPSEAVKLKGDETGVYRVVDDRAEWTPVRTGASDGIRTEIIGGLSGGEDLSLSDEIRKGGENSGLSRGLWRLRRR